MTPRPTLVILFLAACGFHTQGTPDAGSDAPVVIDAPPPPDAPAIVFDPANCPASYRTVPGTPSRYHWGVAIVVPGSLIPWSFAAQRCAAEATPGGYATHLAVFATPGERDAVWNVAGPDIGYNWSWTGAFRAVNTSAWSSQTGEPILPSWKPGEPVVRAGSSIHALAIGSSGGPMGDIDLPSDWAENAICECDGRSVIAMP